MESNRSNLKQTFEVSMNTSDGGQSITLSGMESLESSPQSDRDSMLKCNANSGDEFWDALSSNYDYLMDDGLIVTCREASSDLSLEDENDLPDSGTWTFKRFIEQSKWLHDILHNLQISKDDESNGRNAKIFEEHKKISYLCKLFNEQAQNLCKKYPEIREEVQRRLNLLNNKWKAVVQSIHPNTAKSFSQDCMLNEITNRMSSLRKWLRDLENRLNPGNLDCSWTFEDLKEEYQQQISLQKEIEEGKGRYVSSLLKLCEHLNGNVRFGQNSLVKWDAERVRKVAKNLEQRWHSILLQSLEYNIILENLLQNSNTGCDKLEKSFSEEPLKKYPKLSDKSENFSPQRPLLISKMSYPDEIVSASSPSSTKIFYSSDTSPHKACGLVKNDKAVMVGDTGIAQLKAECASGTGKFEIIQDIGYSSETSTHLSTDEKPEGTETFKESSLKKLSVTESPIYFKACLAPDKYPSMSLKTFNIISEDRSFQTSKCTSGKGASSTFYKVACIDDEDFEETQAEQSCSKLPILHQTLMKEDINTIPSNGNSNPAPANENTILKPVTETAENIPLTPRTHTHTDESIQQLLKSIEKEVATKDVSSILDRISTVSHRKSKMRSKAINFSLESNEMFKRSSARVSEWLKKCNGEDCGTVNSSCDASGECTTESDSDKSNASDVNNSVTMSQSFTGSIETVVPALPEETQPNQAEDSTVKMRKKKRTVRDRPWSVIELHQEVAASASVPYSASESALDLLQSSLVTSSTVPCYRSKKLGRKNAQKSLMNINLPNFIRSHPANGRCLQHSQSHSDELVMKWKKELANDSEKEISVQNSTKGIEKASIPDVIVRCEEKCSDVQVILSETSSLPETASGCGGSVEDQGSLSSDQAWDGFQDSPYLSEPYSEQLDEDEVRKVISFGDDYRDILSSYSDTSSVSVKLPSFRHRARTRSSLTRSLGEETYGPFSSDTNSDTEDFHHILKTSNHAYNFVNSAFKELQSKAEPQFLEKAELIATCQTNLCHLNAIASANGELESVPIEDVLRLRELIKKWEELDAVISSFARNDKDLNAKNYNLETAAIDVHSSLALLKEKLCSLADHAAEAVDTTLSLNQIEANILILQAGLSKLQEMKDSVLSVSARILRLIAEGGGSSLAPLKENATKLYQQWEDVYELNCSQLTKLQTLQTKWNLSSEEQIKEDLETTVQWQPVQVGNNLPTAEIKREALQPRTAAEVQIADQHNILTDIESDVAKPVIQCILSEKREDEMHVALLHSNLPIQRIKTVDDKDSKNRMEDLSSPSRSCWWRAFRASLPIQLAMVSFYCLSWLMSEPQCCEHLNNYEFCLLPQLRYLNGPPPI